MITLARWEREEFDAILNEALDADPDRRPTSETAQRAAELIDAAEQAGREWPAVVRGNALEAALYVAQKSMAKREETVLIDHQGQVVGKSQRVGRQVRRDDGSKGFQQSLFEEMTWAELDKWLDLIASQIEGLKPNLSMGKRLKALHAAVPDSTGPKDAAASLGMTVKAWLEAAS